MGTNFYLELPESTAKHFESNPIHIGKSSAGWVFTLNAKQTKATASVLVCLDTWEKWVPYLKMGVIVDEYGSKVTYEEFVFRVTEKNRTYCRWVASHPGTSLPSLKMGRRVQRSNVIGRYSVSSGEWC